MRYFQRLCIILAVLCLTACGKEELGDTYVEGMDNQYLMHSQDFFERNQARGEHGYFFKVGKYVYYLPDGTDTLVPLCSKVDCMHTDEVDKEKYAMCDAYFTGKAGSGGIAYQDGYLYLFCTEFEEAPCQSLYRIKEDGTGKELIYQWEDHTIWQWCIHRGDFFYVEDVYYEDEETKEVIEEINVKKIPLDSYRKPTPEMVYEKPEGIELTMVEDLKAYGNYLYFLVVGSTGTDEDIMGENWLDYFYSSHTVVNLSTGEQSEISVPGADSAVCVQRATFWQDKVVYLGYDFADEQGLRGKEHVYMSDLDGRNPEVILEDVEQGTRLIADEDYLYLANTAFVIREGEERQIYQVYDKEMQLVDSIGIPYTSPKDREIGYADGFYYFNRISEDKIALLYFDKSTIGTHQGKDFEYKIVTEWHYANADLADER